MAELLLPSLEIENFRAFKHLTIEKLGRVNLIVGKNGAGKTTLLEAVDILRRNANVSFLEKLAALRNDHSDTTFNPAKQDQSTAAFVEQKLSALRSLFWNQRAEYGATRILIGQCNPAIPLLKIGINLYREEYADGPAGRTVNLVTTDESKPSPHDVPCLWVKNLNMGSFAQETETRLDREILLDSSKSVDYPYIPANGLANEDMEAFWNRITLTAYESHVISALQIINANIERLGWVGGQGNRPERYPLVKLRGIDEPIPLRRLGDGATRALGIALALTNSKHGFLLIDEFENGLHYSVQTELWRLIFRLAQELNVQVFATTHNWDCIEAFQKAALEDQNEEAMLIRLQSRNGTIEPVLYDERRLAIATKEMIEVR